MAVYEIHTADGKVYEIHTDDTAAPQNAATQARNSALGKVGAMMNADTNPTAPAINFSGDPTMSQTPIPQAAGNHPLNTPTTVSVNNIPGVNDMSEGLGQVTRGGVGNVVHGVRKTVQGLGEAAAPALVPAAIMAGGVPAAVGLAAGQVAAPLAQGAAKLLGADEDTAGDIGFGAGALAGAAGEGIGALVRSGKVAPKLSLAMQEIQALTPDEPIPMSMAQKTGNVLAKRGETASNKTFLGQFTGRQLIEGQEKYFQRNAPELVKAYNPTMTPEQAGEYLSQAVPGTLADNGNAAFQAVVSKPAILADTLSQVDSLAAATGRPQYSSVQAAAAVRDALLNRQTEIAQGSWVKNADKLQKTWNSIPDAVKSQIMSPDEVAQHNNLYTLLSHLKETMSSGLKSTPSVLDGILGVMGFVTHGVAGLSAAATTELGGGTLGWVLRSPKIYDLFIKAARTPKDSSAAGLLQRAIVSGLQSSATQNAVQQGLDQ